MKSVLRFLLITMLIVAATPALCQGASDATVSEPCRAVQNRSLQELEKEFHDQELALASTKSKVEAVPAPQLDSSLKDQLTRDQGKLIELLYKLECFRSDLQPNAELVRGEGSTVEITAFYATNRQPTGSTDPYQFYNATDTRQLAYGQTIVSIPSQHKFGELELPRLWKLERNPDPRRHFMIRSVVPLSAEDNRRLIAANLQGARSKSLLLFVHGFDVSFSDAAVRIAQLAHDLRFPGVPMFFSWPSAGTFYGYLHDEESSELAKRQFDRLLDELSHLDMDDIYLVAHSMGNRIVGQTLAGRVQEQKDVRKIREIMLAAPDINAELFASEIAPKLVAIQGAQKTIYASSKDLALRASKLVHGFRRVGETTAGIQTFPQIGTIDATGVAPLLRAFGHSYVLDSAAVLGDIEDVVVWRRDLTQRSLKKLGVPPGTYWTFK
jgi:esterase/lipase superfamily enzyme